MTVLKETLNGFLPFSLKDAQKMENATALARTMEGRIPKQKGDARKQVSKWHSEKNVISIYILLGFLDTRHNFA